MTRARRVSPGTAHGLFTAALLAGLVCATGARADAAAPDWASLAEARTVRISTTDPNGKTRTRTVWLAVVDGQGYVRAGGTSRWDRWVDERPDVVLEAHDERFELLAVRVPKGATYDAVVHAMREKYGLLDGVIGVFRRIGGPRVLRLDPRPAAAGP
jgi:hypothetical protein